MHVCERCRTRLRNVYSIIIISVMCLLLPAGPACDGKDHEGMLVCQRRRSSHSAACEEVSIPAQSTRGHQNLEQLSSSLNCLSTPCTHLERTARDLHSVWRFTSIEGPETISAVPRYPWKDTSSSCKTTTDKLYQPCFIWWVTKQQPSQIGIRCHWCALQTGLEPLDTYFCK